MKAMTHIPVRAGAMLTDSIQFPEQGMHKVLLWRSTFCLLRVFADSPRARFPWLRFDCRNSSTTVGIRR